MSSRAKKPFRFNWGMVPVYLFVGAWAVSILFVLIWLVYTSFKTTPEFLRNIYSLPSSLNFTGYVADITGKGGPGVPLGKFLINSTIVSFGSILGILLVSIPAGYVLSKPSRSATVTFYFCLGMVAIPGTAVLIPEYFFLHDLGLINTFYGLIVPYVSFNIPFSIILARSFFKSFPRELEEAARIDGLSDFGIFRKIVLPLSVVIMIIITVINFPAVWNELLYASVIVPGPDVKTVQPALLLYSSYFKVEYTQTFAGLVLASLPVIIFYIIFQKYIMRSVFIGAIRG